MIERTTLITDFGTWISEYEADRFLDNLGVSAFGIEPGYDLLQQITEAVITQLPFHNIFLLTRPPAPPTPNEIREDMLSKKGGPCGTMNTFLGALLRVKGFEVDLVSATIMEPDCHLGLLVSIDKDRYYLDAGDGKPYYEPMKINDTAVKKYPSHCFRYHTDRDNLIIQYQIEPDQWNTTCTVHLVPRKFSFFETSILKHYTDESYGPFSRNLRLVKYPGRKIIGFRNFTYLKEENQEYIRKELPDFESLRNMAELHFGIHQLPIQQAIDLLSKKGAIRNG